LAAAAGLGIAVAAVLAAYARVSPGDGAAISTFGFSALYAMKSWLTTAAMVFVVVQVVSALAMWGRLPGVAASPGWAGPLHRWSGVAAFVLTLPVAFQCIWSAGFSDDTTRTLVHSLAGCLFYGAFAAKMLPPGQSASGFFYFQTGFMRSSTLFVSGLKDAKSGEEIFYFEIPLTEALK